MATPLIHGLGLQLYYAEQDLWDFADGGGQFWPFGGLLHRDLTPKESYLRLLKLQHNWGLK